MGPPPPPALPAASAGSREDYRSVVGAGVGAIHHEGHGVVLHLDELGGVVCDLLRDGSYAGDRLPGIADDWIAGGCFQLGVAELGDAVDVLDDVDSANAGEFFGRGGVDGDDASVGNGRVDHARVEHAGEIDVGGVFALAHGFGWAVVANGGLADVGEFGIGGERRRLVDGDGSLFFLQAVLRDAEDEGVGAGGGGWLRGIERHVRPPFL